jgi:hypothetical protein
MRNILFGVVGALLFSGCAPTFVVHKTEQISSVAPVEPVAAPSPPTPPSAPSNDDGPSLSVNYPLPPDVARIQILTDKHPKRSAEVLAVFDFHTDASSEDKGFDQLRLAAARVGADAVIGAEFEHGDDGGKSHLAGVAVRFLE